METNLINANSQVYTAQSNINSPKQNVSFGSYKQKDTVETSEEKNKTISPTKKTLVSIGSIIPGVAQMLNKQFAKGTVLMGAAGGSVALFKMGQIAKNSFIKSAAIVAGICVELYSFIDGINSVKTKSNKN